MQEKIGQIINDWHLKASRTIYWQENAAAEIATLFERKVIWETEGFVVHGLKTSIIRIKGSGANLYPKEELDSSDGQRVRVIVEEIDESRT